MIYPTPINVNIEVYGDIDLRKNSFKNLTGNIANSYVLSKSEINFMLLQIVF